MRLIICLELILVLFLSVSCNKTANVDSDGQRCDTVGLKYAEHINIIKCSKYDIVELKDPWKKVQVLHKYVLVHRKDSANIKNLPEGTIVYVPIKSSVVFNSSHCQLLSWLGVSNLIKGVCDKQYIKLEDIQNGLKKGTIADCGSSIMPMVERVVDLNPDIIMLSPFENASYGQLEKVGIPIIECAEYMETSALGRSEWMKFYGLLFGCEERADSLFNVVDSCYNKLKEAAKAAKSHPKVLTERKTGNVWYCPGGNSTMGKLFKDANISYAFSNDTHSGSLSLSPEFVIDKAGDADVWLIMSDTGNPITRKDLLLEYSGYSELKAFRDGKIYVCYTSRKRYFEEVSFRPDFLLSDLIRIFHPDVSVTQELRYYVAL